MSETVSVPAHIAATVYRDKAEKLERENAQLKAQLATATSDEREACARHLEAQAARIETGWGTAESIKAHAHHYRLAAQAIRQRSRND